MDFKNKTVLITGGTSGIGLSLANLYFKHGASVYRTSTKKQKLLKNNKLKNFLDTIIVDFNKSDETENFLDKIKKIKKIDILINNAGINKINSIDKIPESQWDEIMHINLKIPFIISKIISNKMIRRKKGNILNIASIFSEISKMKRASYSSSKFGLVGLTKAMALDLSKYDIIVNSVSPGFVETNLTKRILNLNELEDIKKTIPLKRMAQTKEIASLILYLTSDKNTYLTGQNIIIDGGFSIA